MNDRVAGDLTHGSEVGNDLIHGNKGKNQLTEIENGENWKGKEIGNGKGKKLEKLKDTGKKSF